VPAQDTAELASHVGRLARPTERLGVLGQAFQALRRFGRGEAQRAGVVEQPGHDTADQRREEQQVDRGEPG